MTLKKFTAAALPICALALTACSSQEDLTNSTSAAPTAAPSLSLTAEGAMSEPGAGEGTPASALPEGELIDMGPIAANASELERLTLALRMYYDDAELPAIKTLEPLVQRRLIKSVPVPPPGMKYVIDLTRMEVRLEKQ